MVCPSEVRDAAQRGGADELDVLVQGAAGGLEGRRRPRLPPPLQLPLLDLQRHRLLAGVDVDHVTVFHLQTSETNGVTQFMKTLHTLDNAN